MGVRTRAFDWGPTALGPPETWPQALQAAVSTCLGSRHPIVVWWGEALTQFYNDPYISFLGPHKHPKHLGGSARDCWSEIWPVISPMVDGVFATGEATWSEDLLLVLQRSLPREEAYFTFSYSPIRDLDDGSVCGIFCACNETTERVIGERRLRTLRDLGQAEAEAATPEGACEAAARVVGENAADIPFALIYLLDRDGGTARLVASAGAGAGLSAVPDAVSLQRSRDVADPWPLAGVLQSGRPQLVEGLGARFGGLPGGPWPESPDQALVLPIAAPGQSQAAGFLVCGLSPRRVVDAEYGSFLALVAGHIGACVANARAYDEERRRAEALAELDRAKTAFFSNVSHEFRTPLTLMLGPLEQILAAPENIPAVATQADVAHRNGVRLLRLVNNLLDFSRIEAGRVEARFQPTDLGGLVTDLASNFRSAVERAGLSLEVEIQPGLEPVFVDHGMIEKIVLNLLSNAFKFTLNGGIRVKVEAGAPPDECLVTVADTGVGIPAAEIPRLFERFHRVQGAKGRSYEGTGIGLALVHQLIQLHGGRVEVESTEEEGSVFRVVLPLGYAHLPPDQVFEDAGPTTRSANTGAFVEEALRWLPDGQDVDVDGAAATSVGRGERVLLVEDNADMRNYLARLLREAGFEVASAPDGQAALEALRRSLPDLLLTDVMMPRLDGFGLLRAVRGDPVLADLPVIMLSARAGEDAGAEGLDAGADDYLIKPFTARELVARVSANLKLANARRDSARRLELVFQTLPVGVAVVDPSGATLSANEAMRRFLPSAIIPSLDPERRERWVAHHPDGARVDPNDFPTARALRGESTVPGLEMIYTFDDGREVWARVASAPIRDARDRIVGAFSVAVDIDAMKRAEAHQQILLHELQHRVRNLLAVMMSLVRRTGASAATVVEMAELLEGRIAALARTQVLLSRGGGVAVDLESLVRDELLAQAADNAVFSLAGPDVSLSAKTAEVLTLAIHELATNAAKYGAIASGGGLKVSWSLDRRTDGPDWLRLDWIEDGVEVTPGALPRAGFGTELIERRIPRELKGQGRLELRPGGLAAELSLPLATGVSILAGLEHAHSAQTAGG